MDIKEIRKKIDRIDDDILELLSQRISLLPHIAEYKMKNQLSIVDKKREKVIIERMKKEAKKHNLNPDFAEEIFNKIINESKRIQVKYQKNIGKRQTK